MIKAEIQIRKTLAEYTRLTYEKGYTPPLSGNLSMRLDDGHILITPSYFSKGLVTEADLLKVDFDGNVIDGGAKPSVETPIHLAFYKNRPEINAVIHAHPRDVLAFAAANRPINAGTVPEAVYMLGEIADIPYHAPGTDALREAIEAYIKDRDTFLLYNHGMITAGRTMAEAFYRMETMEFCAHADLYAALLGGSAAIGAEERQKLVELRKHLPPAQ